MQVPNKKFRFEKSTKGKGRGKNSSRRSNVSEDQPQFPGSSVPGTSSSSINKVSNEEALQESIEKISSMEQSLMNTVGFFFQLSIVLF